MLTTSSFETTLVTDQVVINAGQSLSSVQNCVGMQLIGAVFPDNWTNGNVSFYGADGFGSNISEFQLMTDVDGSDLVIGATASRRQPFLPYLFIGASYIQLYCSNPQANNVTIRMIMQPIFQGIHN